ncbi:MAG: hypothetical protein RQ748_11030, partial [Elusimicrobiales bacterium]|nr:hypothetical protein [Elusimicrobiales bacterium]
TNNQVYSFSVSGQDLAGNAGAYAAISVTSDFNYPTITISTPMAGANAFYGPARVMTTLRGNSADSPAGIVPPLLAQISNISESGAVKPKWDGSQWSVVDSTWMAVTALLPWTFSSPAWPENKRFQVELTGLDAAGNSVPPGTYTRDFIYDVNKPSSSIAGLAASGFRNPSQIAGLSGRALDWVNDTLTQDYSGLLPDGVEIQIVDPSGNTYSGSGWGGPGNWRKAVFTEDDFISDGLLGDIIQTADWSYPRAPDTWPSALTEKSTYTVRVRAMDRSLNLENYVQASFCYDASAPTATVTMPGNFAYTALPVISGGVLEEVSALNPVDGVQLVVQRVSDLNYWNGASWDGAFNPVNHWKNATSFGGGNWSYADANLDSDFNNLFGENAALQFRIYVRAKDVTGNISRPDPAPSNPNVTFTIDPIVPTSKVTAPSSGTYLNATISAIDGTASDWSSGVPSGLNNVRVRVSRLNSVDTREYYNWTFDSWSTNQANWLFQTVDAALDPWTKSIPGSAFTGANTGDGYRFEIQSEARDNTQPVNGGPNLEVAYATSTFVIDFSTPLVHISSPAHQGFFSVMPSVYGTASDPAGPGGLAGGLVSIEYELIDIDRSPVQYWNFNTLAWQPGYVSSVTAPSAGWSRTALPVANPLAANSWAVGRSSATFALRLKATDRAGNYAAFHLNRSTFTLDIQEPDSKVSIPAVEDGSLQTLAAISGTADDATSGVRSVRLRIQQDTAQSDCVAPANNGQYWNGSSWQAGSVWLPVDSYDGFSKGWTFASAGVVFKPQCFYVINSSAADVADNGESSFGSRRFKFTPPPAVTRIAVPGNLRYQKALTVISGTANSDAKSLALEIRRLSDNYYWNFASQAWQGTAVSTAGLSHTAGNWSYDWNLPVLTHNSSYTLRSVGTNFSDVQELSPVTVQIYYDTQPPDPSVTLPAAAAAAIGLIARLLPWRSLRLSGHDDAVIVLGMLEIALPRH